MNSRAAISELVAPSAAKQAICASWGVSRSWVCGQAVQPIKERKQQLVQCGEAQVHLRLDPGHPGLLHVACQPDCVVEQRRLSRPRLTPEHQRATALSPSSTVASRRSSASASTTRSTSMPITASCQRAGHPGRA